MAKHPEFLNDWGISSESPEDFARRNTFDADMNLPEGLESGFDVHFSDKINFLPMIGFESVDWDKMHWEADQFRKHYVPHRHHESHRGWSSLCIHGLSSVHTEAHHTYGYEDREHAPYRWTDVASYCPTITDFFMNHFDYKDYDRIRIMKLDPGGYVIPHKDSIVIEENHIGPTNVALNNPENCNFYMEDIGILPFEQGSVIKLNLYNVHCVYNHSNEPRYHMIAHGRAGESWNQRMLDSYNYWRTK